jgi:hypothetical protein
VDAYGARLYLVAAEDNPLIAAWISVLDEHGMHCRTEIAPQDWEAAFEDLFSLGFVDHSDFNALDFKRAFRRRPPPIADVEAALNRLASLRQLADEDHHQEISMSKSDRSALDFPLEREESLSLTSAERQKLGMFYVDEPAALVRERVGALAPALAAGDLFAPSIPAARGLATSADGLELLGSTRRALERVSPERTSLARRPAAREDEDGEPIADPRPYISELDMRLHCCGRELELLYEDGHDVSHQLPQSGHLMLEFTWSAACPICNTEHHHTATRPYPADYNPR